MISFFGDNLIACYTLVDNSFWSHFNCCKKFFIFSKLHKLFSCQCTCLTHAKYKTCNFRFRRNKRKDFTNFFLLGKAIEMSILYWNKRSYPFKTAPYYIPIILSVLIPFCITVCILRYRHVRIERISICICPACKSLSFHYRILWNRDHIIF